MEEQKFIQDLKDKILNYDKILFVIDEVHEIIRIFNKGPKKLLKRNLILLKNTINSDLDDIDCIQIERKRSEMLRDIYYTYEFSNKFVMLSTDSNFGTIWNYVKTGLLSPEEAVSALLD